MRGSRIGRKASTTPRGLGTRSPPGSFQQGSFGGGNRIRVQESWSTHGPRESWSIARLDHSVRTGPQLSLHLSPTLPSHAQGSLIKDPPKYWQACHSGLIPAHCPPATRTLCFYSPSRGAVRGKECDRQGRQDTLHWDLRASLLLTPTRRIGALLETARTLLKGHSVWLMAEMVPMRHSGAHK